MLVLEVGADTPLHLLFRHLDSTLPTGIHAELESRRRMTFIYIPQEFVEALPTPRRLGELVPEHVLECYNLQRVIALYDSHRTYCTRGAGRPQGVQLYRRRIRNGRWANKTTLQHPCGVVVSAPLYYEWWGANMTPLP